MRPNKILKTGAAALASVVLFAGSASAGQKQRKNVDASAGLVTVVVTVHPHDDKSRQSAAELQPADFSVSENGRKQEIVSAKPAAEAPLVIGVLIQDNLTSGVSNDIRSLKNFIKGLPDGSRVLTGYLTSGSVRVQEDFTADLVKAADSLRIPVGSELAAPGFLYQEVVEALKRFDGKPAGRRILLIVSDGFDFGRGFRSASPALNPDLPRAIREARRRGIAVYSMYAPGAGTTAGSRLAASYGQGALNRLADETGGDAFFAGTTYVSLDPFIKEFGEQLSRQWVITYRSSTRGSGFRRIEVTTEADIHLHYPNGYEP